MSVLSDLFHFGAIASRSLSAHAEHLVVEDRRRTGMGRIEGRDAYVESVKALWELTPESRFENARYWLAIEPWGAVAAARRSGTVPGGGEFCLTPWSDGTR